MATSEQVDPSKPAARKPKVTRSRNGCWTCRARKKKCDETHPECLQCRNKGLKCEGYEARLKWGNGIASRGYLKGMNCPTMMVAPQAPATTTTTTTTTTMMMTTTTMMMSSAKSTDSGDESAARKACKQRPPAAERDVTKEAGKSSEEPQTESAPSEVDSLRSIGLSPFDRELFLEFKRWGAQCLAMGSESGYSPFEEVVAYCDESESLMANCLMFQLSLSPQYQDRQEAYYAEALRLFRRDVYDSASMSKDATIIAGILLCSVGMQNCKSWTMHLGGLHSILAHRHAIQNQTPIASELVCTIGFLDLPSHIVGRQTAPLNIWRDYCRGKTGIEPTSGMPYSLLDIFAVVGEPDAEWRFWSWNPIGLTATSARSMLWTITQLAGVILAREKHPWSRRTTNSSGEFSSPSTETLVDRVLAQLGSMSRGGGDDGLSPSTINLLLFPAFVAGSQHAVVSASQRAFLEAFWADFFSEDGTGSPHLALPLRILRELWTNANGRSADQVARGWDVEVGLF
ncbi:hypothetical protein LOZ53_001755 [Ophidiomyces ophidiicola]|nr:hypothetical protein LOZ55_004319 [Ophidiomyces ophidiicola]KAI1988962.1 hypothetical protein LOZ51_005353 [Ophidiomyces ophidiicola]KAI1994628.1 hypothetical protein LOZ53_001755 [Ophidiomyces ophidiicola]